MVLLLYIISPIWKALATLCFVVLLGVTANYVLEQ